MATVVVKPAFRYEYGPGSLKKVETIGMPKERRFSVFVFGAFIAIHLFVLALNPSWFLSPPKFDMEESTAVDLDFMTDLTLKSPEETALPNAKKADDAAVAANLLPQLPKKFEVTDQAKVEEKPIAEEKDPKAEEALAEKKVTTPPKEEVPKQQEDPNKVNLDELRRRQTHERLRQENKIDKENKARLNAMARLKEEMSAEDSNSNSGRGGAAGNSLAKGYQDLLRAAVKRNFYLPKSFEYESAKLQTELVVVINSKGELDELKLSRSSGNEAYDQAVIAAMQNSAPLPKPTSEYVGRTIKFKF